MMKTELQRDRIYRTQNTSYFEYRDTEIKMLDVCKALKISEPKISFSVPVKITRYSEHLDERVKEDH